MGSKAKNKDKNKNKMKDEPNNSDGNGSKKIISDLRFASVHSDPKFQKVPKNKTKVTIDPRFHHMFTDKRFASSSAPLDKRGKPKKEKNSQNPLRHYYQVEEESEKLKEEKEVEEEEEKKAKRREGESESEKSIDVASGSESSESESSSKEDDDVDDNTTTTDEEDGDIYQENEASEAEEAVPEIEKETRRLAVVNMDWRYVKAIDLYVILSSFLPRDGQISSVSVYPSEFGIQRMKEEELHGPIGLFDDENKHTDEDEDDDDDDEIDVEKLRAYEKSRLSYYYAVVECDSVATADYLYKACDGVEFERSSNKLDLRFIPDDMEFKHPPRDVATEGPSNYAGLDYYTKALQHSNVNLSWDDDEPDRAKTLKRKFNADQLAELELQEFLASDGSESDDEEDNVTEEQSDKKSKKRDMYRALVQSGGGSDEEDGGEEDEAQEMEVTFNTGLEDISKRILEKKDKKSETVWETYLRKRREKKKARKNKSNDSSDDESSDTDGEAVEDADDFFVDEPPAKKSKKDGRGKNGKEGKEQQDTDEEADASRAELELLLADDNAVNGLRGYNLKPKKAKGKKGKQVPDDNKIPTADFDDPRFSALYTSPLFALDPTDPQFKRSATYARQVAQKHHKGEQPETVQSEPSKLAHLSCDGLDTSTQVKSGVSSKREKYELSSLVKSLKAKSKQVQSLPSNDKKSKKKEDGLISGDVKEKKKKGDLSSLVQSLKKKTTSIRK